MKLNIRAFALTCGICRGPMAELDEVRKAASLIRLGFLAAMPTAKFLDAVGSISDQRRVRLSQKAFGLSASAVSFCDTHTFFAPIQACLVLFAVFVIS